MSEVLPENVCGRPVVGGNFYGRTRDVARLWARLETDHVLLTAPRRVGKTSLMYALHAGGAAREGWFGAVYFSAENAVDELDFVSKLYAEIAASPGCEHVASALKGRAWASTLGEIAKVTAAGLALELRQAAPTTWTVLAADLEDAVQSLPPHGRLLVMVDELPVFLLRLLAIAPARAQDFLGWFRAFRQGRPERSDDVRWLLAGSIGLAPLARRQHWSKLINDLQPLTIDALAPEAADGLLSGLAERYDLQLTPEGKAAALERVGWPIPYFLQLLVGKLRDLPPGPIEVDGVEAAFQRLLSVSSSKDFAPWWERLHDELGPTDAAAARAILSACAADANGAPVATLAAAVANHWTDADREEHRSALLETLEHDGYLANDEARWRFRSPLLRAAWLARTAR
ncbi:MAG: hypothetical protein Q8P41_27065 [Pseudomonadota bacterium]|nr:hypothetical protein [Pseudomonadota bacterium]